MKKRNSVLGHLYIEVTKLKSYWTAARDKCQRVSAFKLGYTKTIPYKGWLSEQVQSQCYSCRELGI